MLHQRALLSLPVQMQQVLHQSRPHKHQHRVALQPLSAKQMPNHHQPIQQLTVLHQAPLLSCMPAPIVPHCSHHRQLSQSAALQLAAAAVAAPAVAKALRQAAHHLTPDLLCCTRACPLTYLMLQLPARSAEAVDHQAHCSTRLLQVEIATASSAARREL